MQRIMSEAQIDEARKFRLEGWTRKELASRYDVSYSTIGRMLTKGVTAGPPAQCRNTQCMFRLTHSERDLIEKAARKQLMTLSDFCRSTVMREAERVGVEKCPTCDSPKPHLHPAMQHGGEVQPCNHPFHGGIKNG